MNKFLNFFTTSDRFLVLTISSAIFSIIFILLGFLLLYKSLPPKIPLYYSLPWGENQLVAKSQFLIIPLILILLTLTNLFITSQIHPAQKVLRKTILLTIPLTCLILLLSVLKIFSIFI